MKKKIEKEGEEPRNKNKNSQSQVENKKKDLNNLINSRSTIISTIIIDCKEWGRGLDL